MSRRSGSGRCAISVVTGVSSPRLAVRVQASEGFTLLRGALADLPFVQEKNKMATSVWNGAISFGLLSIPIRLYAAARPERIKLHQIHKECHTRLRQPLYCPTHRRIVDRSEVVRGYEYEKG